MAILEPPEDDELQAQLAACGAVLAARQRDERLLDNYFKGECPFPDVIKRAKLKKAYRALMGITETPWGRLVVNAVLNRLDVTGIDSGDSELDQAAWAVWRNNKLGARSKLAHKSALKHGRCFGLVWPDDDDQPRITFDTMGRMVVMYEEGDTDKRIAAMRYWRGTDNVPYANLYRADGIFKYRGRNKTNSNSAKVEWVKLDDDEWFIENPFNVVPVVELAVNRDLASGSFGYAEGEFQAALGIIDQINLLTFLRIVVSVYQGFPMRALIGTSPVFEILKDDDGNPILDSRGKVQDDTSQPKPPFDADAGGIAVIPDDKAKLDQYAAANPANLNVYSEYAALAAFSDTPRHYFPIEQLSNVNADTIRANETGLVAKVPERQASLGDGWQEMLRVAGQMMPDGDEFDLPAATSITWSDHENRSLSERADAAVKLANILPRQALMEFVLDPTPEQLSRWLAGEAGDAFASLVRNTVANATPQPATPQLTVVGNGAGA